MPGGLLWHAFSGAVASLISSSLSTFRSGFLNVADPNYPWKAAS
ncbi:MAG: hypothetical protein N3A68_08985 [Bacteroidia bacterium]|nr:hypothetical protein [Bacteroidia bacterium]